MRRKYFCICSGGGSIYTVSTVLGRRMGKYMKKTKSLQTMEVSQSSQLMHGVRTRARALAYRAPLHEPLYMHLRSRPLAKISKHHQKGRKFADRSIDRASASALSGSRRPSSSHVELRLCDYELLDNMPPRNSCSSRPALASVAVSATTAPSTDASVSHSRVASPAQSSLRDSNLAAAMSMQARAILGRGATRMLTRNLKQELKSKLLADAKAMDMDIDGVTPEAASASGNAQRETEVEAVEPGFGESPVIAGSSSRERHQGPNIHSEMRECILDLLIQDVGAPGSTSRMCHSSQIRSSSAPPFSRSNEDPSSTEIEHFFASAEQKERRRFIVRYNFDPLTEKPLKGRYLWHKE